MISVAMAGGCKSNPSTIQRPTSVPAGTPVRPPVTASIGPDGGTLSSSDGRVTINIPRGAVTTATSFSIQEITNTAPRGLGASYRLGPDGAKFRTAVAITFRTNAFTTPADRIAVVYQDPSGYWVPVLSALRNKVASLVTAQTNHFTDWTLVPSDPTLDMAGNFTVNSTVSAPGAFTAVGTAGLAYAGEDTVERVYLFSGSTTLQPFTYGGVSCTATPSATYSFPPNVAEAFKSQPRFDWGTSALWDLTCGTTPQFIEMVFDTAGISHVGCARGYTTGAPAPVVTQDTLTGDYTIDCTGQGNGTMRASWSFQRCGAPCTSTNACAATAVYSCASGTPVCTVQTTQPVGTSCTVNGASGVCDSTGTCVACSAGAACTSTNPCAATAAIVCSSGAPVCTDQTYDAVGTSCSTSTFSGVCNASGTCTACTPGATCTSTNPCATASNVVCSSGAPVCTDQTFAAAGSSCTTSTFTGVCSPTGTCTACSQGATCTSTNPCATGATINCSSGAPVCSDQAFQPAGTPCASGATTGVCSPSGVCTACTQGATCTSGNPCALTSTIDCSTGTPVCKDQTFTGAGTACSSGSITGVCSTSGTCTACSPGASCTSSDPCALTATIDCSSGAPVCKTQSLQAVGAACTTGGVSGVCDSSGVCTACTQGATCTSTNPCDLTATIDCSSGAPVCRDQTFQPTGTSCSSGTTTGTCSSSGVCTACTQGASCTSTDPCALTATINCSSGAPVCTVQTYQPAGSACTSGTTTGVCSSTGVCTDCTAGATCTSTNPCAASAAIVCSSGASVCTPTSYDADGTSCSTTTSSVCLAGTCTLCTSGASCVPSNPCHVGSMSCGDPTTVPPTPPNCVDTGVAVADATACSTSTVTNGICVAGTCGTCVAGTSCTLTGTCDLATISCGDPTASPPTGPTCSDSGTSRCTTGQTCDTSTGQCI